MSLGEVISFLERWNPAQVVPLGFTYPHSYRGYYDELAFEPKANVTVGVMLAAAKSALDQTFDGYKGGEYTMKEYTQCWLAEYGTSGGETIGPVLLTLMLAVPHSPELAAELAKFLPEWPMDATR